MKYKFIPVKLYNYIQEFILIYKNKIEYPNFSEISLFLEEYIKDMEIIFIPEKNFCEIFLSQISESIYNEYGIIKNNNNNFINYI